ncbi:hypothetical protein [Leptolyngbya sp. ST-U4]|uniref:hypothetical protein n=1 Tax=Leptolyngbya sp. ST-U4 TaxID=2933912 RepID=UPI00198E779D|nr:hypothetical protein [Cyanobacteria bacterium FACHB-502]
MFLHRRIVISIALANCKSSTCDVGQPIASGTLQENVSCWKKTLHAIEYAA